MSSPEGVSIRDREGVGAAILDRYRRRLQKHGWRPCRCGEALASRASARRRIREGCARKGQRTERTPVALPLFANRKRRAIACVDESAKNLDRNFAAGVAMAAKIFRWLVFTILFSLIPILVSYVAAAATTTATGWPDVGSVLEHGELYLLASSFSAAGLGEVIVLKNKWQLLTLILAGTSFLELVLAMLMFAFVNNHAGQHINNLPLDISYFVFAFSCIASTCCIALAEVKDE